MEDWIIRATKLPTGYATANNTVPQPFPTSSPIADLFTLQDLNPRVGAFETKTTDMLGDQVLINHNVYVYVKAMIEANNAVFMKRAAPRALMDAVAIIDELFDAADWQARLEKHAWRLNAITARTKDAAANDADSLR